MKVALINTHDTYGGAARSVFRLHRGLRNAGIESTILCLDKRSDDPNAQILSVDNSVESQKLRNDWNRQQQDVNSRLVKSHCTFFSLPVPGYDISRHPVVLNADVVHLNWVTGILSPDSVGALLDSGKRLVWTLHDQRSFTGGCHFSDGCDEYKSGCAICHFLPSEFATLAQASLLHAEKFYDSSNICIVSPSRWLADCARQSRLFSNCRIELIPYGIDTGVYLPIDKSYARFKNGLSAKAFTILFGSVDLAEKRKGGHVLAAALQHCLKEPAIAAAISTANLEFVTFGRNCSGELWPSCVKHAGYIGTEEQMAELYSASDVFVCPTLDDNLPNTIIEAMSCGVPVIASRVGGVSDLIEDGKDGWLFNPNDSAMLAEKILTLFKEQIKASKAGLEARLKIQKSFTLSLQADNYINIYKDILSKNPFEKKSLSTRRPSSPFKEVANHAPFQSGGSVAKKAGLICVTRNSAIKLKATLESIVRHTNPTLFDLYVVDNGSTDSTAELCAGAWPPNIYFIRKNENLGWVGGINSCLPEAKKYPFIGFLHDDIEVGSRWLEHLINLLEWNNTVGAAGPLTSNDRDWQGYDRFRLGPTKPGLPELEGIDRWNVDQMASAMASFNPGVTFSDAVLGFFCILIRSEIVEQIGPLDEAFNELYLGDDDDYCKRIHATGHLMALSFNAYLVHHSDSRSQAVKDDESRYQKAQQIIAGKAAKGAYSGKQVTIPRNIIRYCISHEPPLLPENWFDEVIKLGDYGRGSEIHISQLSSFWDESRDLSYGAAGSYCIPYAVKKLKVLPELIEINSFRKRVLSDEFGKPSSNYPLMREVLLAAASQIDVESGILKTLSHSNFLVCPPLHYSNGYLKQYTLVHHKTDFLDYAQLAVEGGIISKDDYQNFLECKTFIPGGCELGIYPCKWLLGILSQLEDLGRHFILKHKVRIASYDSYQVRCIGFLSERLGSFLLLKELNARFNNQIPSTVFGHMTTIVPDEKSNYKPATTRFAKKIEKISYPLMWAHLVRKHGIRSVLDVGCGKGDSALNFKSLGCDIKSIDGSQEAQTTNLLGEDFVLADYSVGPSPIQTEFDLVWSCEFVEHVEERFMKNYLQDFRRGLFLAMTFAGPRQPGHHHVNCRPEEYWIRMMYSQGFDYLPEETAELREYAKKDMEKNDSESDKRFFYHFMHRGLFFKNTGTCSGGL